MSDWNTVERCKITRFFTLGYLRAMTGKPKATRHELEILIAAPEGWIEYRHKLIIDLIQSLLHAFAAAP